MWNTVKTLGLKRKTVHGSSATLLPVVWSADIEIRGSPLNSKSKWIFLFLVE